MTPTTLAREWVAPLAERLRPTAGSWAVGLLAGVQGAVLSLLVVVVPAMAAYVATSADPANDAVGWPRAAVVGAALWLLGHGGELVAGGARVSLVPLGLTALVVFGAYASARRSAPRTRAAWLAGTAGHLGVVAVVLLVAGPTGPAGAGGGAVARTLVGATAVAALGVGLGVAAPGVVGAWLDRRLAGVPLWLRRSVRAGLLVPTVLVAVASALVGMWGVAGRAATGDVLAALGVDPFGGAVLGIAQLVLVPNLVVWALAWLTGTGFAVGAGTHVAPDELLGGPMPALPLLGALPSDAGGVLVWAPAVVVAIGVLAALWLHRTLAEDAAWQPVAAAAVVAGVAGLVTGALALASGGAVGPGRLTVVGPPALLVALDTAALVLAGAVVLVPMSRLVRVGVRESVRSAWSRVRGDRGERPAGD